MDADGRRVWWAEVDLGKTMFRAATASWEVILSVKVKFIIIHYYYKLETDFYLTLIFNKMSSYTVCRPAAKC